ncbi:MAG: hypothetical protein VW600_07225, partial [Ferrovibrio sp.]
VEAGWKPAKSLFVVSNGALGLLPLALLPTAPSTVDQKAEPLFTGYKSVPWLVRTHAVTQLPSTAALKTLRGLPAGSAKRAPLMGFGDPLYNAEQGAEAEPVRGRSQRGQRDEREVNGEVEALFAVFFGFSGHVAPQMM